MSWSFWASSVLISVVQLIIKGGEFFKGREFKPTLPTVVSKTLSDKGSKVWVFKPTLSPQ
jgi:hypothetical protein